MSYFSVSMSYFVVWILWPELQIYWQGVHFSINSKKSLMSSTLKISNFCRFWLFAEFYIKIVLLGQSSFERIAFCWVEYCVFQTYIETLKSFVTVTCSWLFQFYSIKFFITSQVKDVKFPTCNLLLGAKVP